MTNQQIKTAAGIAETLKKDRLSAEEVKNYFEKPYDLADVLNIREYLPQRIDDLLKQAKEMGCSMHHAMQFMR